jgi:hypothetical protein
MGAKTEVSLETLAAIAGQGGADPAIDKLLFARGQYSVGEQESLQEIKPSLYQSAIIFIRRIARLITPTSS